MSQSCLGRVLVLSLSFFGDVSVLFWCCLGLVSLMSRWCLGRVSVLSWSCLWWCLGHVSMTSRSCLGDVSVMSRSWSWSCLCLFLVMSRCCFGVVSVFTRWCPADLSVMSRACLGLVYGDVSVMSPWRLDLVLMLSLSCLGDASVLSLFFLVMSRWGVVLLVFWWFGDLSGMCWWRLRHVSVKSPWCVVMVLWCFDDEWVISWCFFWLWWWCFDMPGVLVHFLAHLVALAVASLRLCSCGMVRTSVESKYAGPANKTNTGVQISDFRQSFIHSTFFLKQQEVTVNKPDEEIGPWPSSHQPSEAEWADWKRPLGLSGCFRPSTWIIEWAREQKVSSHVCLSVTGIQRSRLDAAFLVAYFRDTKWGWFKLAHGWQLKRFRLLVIRPYLFCGPG